ncbi:MAG: phospholipase D family protein [Gammaproteobacteria bacterium]|nr:phospholipase D family protein [Gammaproteobacteria bacterium]
MPKNANRIRTWLLPPLLAVLVGCASVDFDYPKTESTAIRNTQNTSLAGEINASVPFEPEESGFYLLTDGIEALAARRLMAKSAETTIDAQYYLITNDSIGMAFIGSLLEAADRGVRVRLLLDDIQTQGYDAGMAALDSHPNFEVRIYNPFSGRGSRASAITEFGRINRRMHNKSFTADNQITIIGGRNIAAEYFAAREDVNFGDADVVGIGPVVSDVSDMFDTYWNSRYALPVPAFAKMPDDPDAELVALRERIVAVVEELETTKYAGAFAESLQNVTDTDISEFTIAPYELAYDSPDKSDKKLAAEAENITTTLAASIARADESLVVISPYFVPLKSGIGFLTGLQDRGVQVTIITNSLAANNHSIVHSGYAPSRKPLLKAGVKIYEVRSDAFVSGAERGTQGAALATLHTKGFIVDDKELFLGSFNWDPRSVDINTELGVIMKSPAMAGSVMATIDSLKDANAYKVILNDKGQVRWVDRAGEEEVILDKEPQTGWWRRFTVGFY